MSKAEQKVIHGGNIGTGSCTLTIFQNGVSSEVKLSGLPDDGPSQIIHAQDECGIHLTGGADRCFYDCSFDD